MSGQPQQPQQPQQLRLSDAERETAASALGEHYAQGRLDVEEHHERHERIWAARTHGEIPPIFSDLPGGSPLHPVAAWSPAAWSPAGGRSPVAPTRARASRRGLPWPLKVLLAVGLVMLVVSHWPLLLVGVGAWWLLSGRRQGTCGPRASRHLSHG
ncbi:MAG: DUF1707 domain-containing protein [Nocardioides sp.]